jgi:hypothetical protein
VSAQPAGAVVTVPCPVDATDRTGPWLACYGGHLITMSADPRRLDFVPCRDRDGKRMHPADLVDSDGLSLYIEHEHDPEGRCLGVAGRAPRRGPLGAT